MERRERTSERNGSKDTVEQPIHHKRQKIICIKHVLLTLLVTINDFVVTVTLYAHSVFQHNVHH